MEGKDRRASIGSQKVIYSIWNHTWEGRRRIYRCGKWWTCNERGKGESGTRNHWWWWETGKFLRQCLELFWLWEKNVDSRYNNINITFLSQISLFKPSPLPRLKIKTKWRSILLLLFHLPSLSRLFYRQQFQTSSSSSSPSLIHSNSWNFPSLNFTFLSPLFSFLIHFPLLFSFFLHHLFPSLSFDSQRFFEQNSFTLCLKFLILWSRVFLFSSSLFGFLFLCLLFPSHYSISFIVFFVLPFLPLFLILSFW